MHSVPAHISRLVDNRSIKIRLCASGCAVVSIAGLVPSIDAFRRSARQADAGGAGLMKESRLLPQDCNPRRVK